MIQHVIILPVSSFSSSIGFSYSNYIRRSSETETTSYTFFFLYNTYYNFQYVVDGQYLEKANIVVNQIPYQVLAKIWRTQNSHALLESKLEQTLWGNVWQCLQKLDTYISYDPAILLLVYIQQICTNICTQHTHPFTHTHSMHYPIDKCWLNT